MTRDDLPPSQDPELRGLQELARRGRDELDAFDEQRADRLWAAVHDEVLGDPSTERETSRRTPSFGWWLPLVAAAIALVVGVGLGTTIDLDRGADDPAMLATIELAPLGEGLEARTASLRTGEGGRTIAVDLGGLPTTSGFHEVWLLDPDTGALVSLGPVRADHVYAVPDTVDLAELSVLDVSDEPRDGDPTHSGDSLLRGEVRWTG